MSIDDDLTRPWFDLQDNDDPYAYDEPEWEIGGWEDESDEPDGPPSDALLQAFAAVDRLGRTLRHEHLRHQEDELVRRSALQRAHFLAALGFDPAPRPRQPDGAGGDAGPGLDDPHWGL